MLNPIISWWLHLLHAVSVSLAAKACYAITFSSIMFLTCFSAHLQCCLSAHIAKDGSVCPSVCLTLVSHGYTVQDIEMHFAILLWVMLSPCPWILWHADVDSGSGRRRCAALPVTLVCRLCAGVADALISNTAHTLLAARECTTVPHHLASWHETSHEMLRYAAKCDCIVWLIIYAQMMFRLMVAYRTYVV